jgi:hypothetical protein
MRPAQRHKDPGGAAGAARFTLVRQKWKVPSISSLAWFIMKRPPQMPDIDQVLYRKLKEMAGNDEV